MSVINIRKAQRAGARMVVGISGTSGSGKTLTALLLAYGLTNGNGDEVGFLDTENRRGSLYASEDTYRKVQDALGLAALPSPFLVGDLEPPFSPKRYIEAIRAFQAAGVKVLVVDSVSHEWEGTGGCEEIAHAQNPRLPDWATAKREHKAFMNALLQCDMHVIVCIRAREKVKIEKVNGKTEVTPIGIQPVCEKNFMFEMTASLMMWNEGKSQDVIKCPAELREILGRGEGYITAADGAALRDWVDGGAKVDTAIEHARNTLRTTTEGGVEAYRKAFEALPKRVKKALNDDGSHATLKRAAEDYDRQRAQSKAGGEQLAGLNEDIEAGD